MSQRPAWREISLLPADDLAIYASAHFNNGNNSKQKKYPFAFKIILIDTKEIYRMCKI